MCVCVCAFGFYKYTKSYSYSGLQCVYVCVCDRRGRNMHTIIYIYFILKGFTFVPFLVRSSLPQIKPGATFRCFATL